MIEDIQQIKQNAENLRKNGLIEEALILYSDMWLNHRSDCDEWIGWGYAYCLRKLNNPTKAIDVCREVYKKNPEFRYIKSVYAWCIYDLEIKKDSEDIKIDEEGFFKAAEKILELVEQEQYSPHEITVLKVLKHLKSKPSDQSEKILQWTGKLDKNKLSTDKYTFTIQNGKHIETSNKGRYYSYRSKALLNTRQYKECIEVCNEALSYLPNEEHFLYKYRIAKSKGNQNQKEEAISELKKLLNFNKKWHIQYDIAYLYFELGLLDEAFEYAIESALNQDDFKFKYKLYSLIGFIFKSQSKLDEAKKHISLALKICEEEKWSIPDFLQQEILELNITPSHTQSASELHKELTKFWNSIKLANLPRQQGVVKTILPHGKAGFINGDNGNDYYFKTNSFNGSHSEIQAGTQVKFFVEKSFDPKKKQESEQAINIEEIA